MKPAAIKVALIGDSIRLNAQPFVREWLPPRFELLAPEENCESSRKVLDNIQRWVPMSGIDIVHLNCGLHDIRHDPGCDRPVSSVEEYEAHLGEIFTYLAATGATIVWATTTPIDEAAHNLNKVSRRYAAHLIEYNRLATMLACEFGFLSNDVYALLMRSGVSDVLLTDGVHFKRDGNVLIGRAIGQSILAASVHVPFHSLVDGG
jgi:isoamyl acetate esterase